MTYLARCLVKSHQQMKDCQAKTYSTICLATAVTTEVGKSYLEKQYEDVLRGQKARVQNVTDRSGNLVSQRDRYRRSAGQ